MMKIQVGASCFLMVVLIGCQMQLTKLREPLTDQQLTARLSERGGNGWRDHNQGELKSTVQAVVKSGEAFHTYTVALVGGQTLELSATVDSEARVVLRGPLRENSTGTERIGRRVATLTTSRVGRLSTNARFAAPSGGIYLVVVLPQWQQRTLYTLKLRCVQSCKASTPVAKDKQGNQTSSPAVKHECTPSMACPNGQRCEQGKCVATATPNGCDADSDCDGRSYCSKKLGCVTRKSAGNVCQRVGECDAGLQCNLGRCAKPVPACSVDSDCQSSEFCIATVLPRTCKAQKTAGQSCDRSGQCAGGLSCEQGRCESASPNPADAGDCSTDDDCNMGNFCGVDQEGVARCRLFSKGGTPCGGSVPDYAQVRCAPGWVCAKAPNDSVGGVCSRAVTVGEIRANPSVFDGLWVAVSGQIRNARESCTQFLCALDNLCCNTCNSAQMLFAPGQEDPDSALDLIDENETYYTCGGTDCTMADNCTAKTGNVFIIGVYRHTGLPEPAIVVKRRSYID